MAKKPDDGSTQTDSPDEVTREYQPGSLDPAQDSAQGSTGDTKEAVAKAAQDAAGGDAALTKAVAAKNDRAAPPSEFEAFMQEAGRRMDQVEQVLGLAMPFLQLFAKTKAGGLDTSQALAQAVTGGQVVIAGMVPSAAPVLARLPALEKTVSDILGALGVHFGAKSIDGLPTALHPADPNAALLTNRG